MLLCLLLVWLYFPLYLVVSFVSRKLLPQHFHHVTTLFSLGLISSIIGSRSCFLMVLITILMWVSYKSKSVRFNNSFVRIQRTNRFIF